MRDRAFNSINDRVDHLRSKCATLRAENERLESLATNQGRELIAHREKAHGNYWAWQGDGEDHLQSLSSHCPVLISAAQLSAIVQENARLQSAFDERDKVCAQLEAKIAKSEAALDKARVFLERLIDLRSIGQGGLIEDKEITEVLSAINEVLGQPEKS